MAYKKGNSKKPYNGKRSSKYNKNQNNITRKDDGAMPARNDFSWYSKNPRLLESVARIPFPYRPGMKLPLYGPETSQPTQSSRITPNTVPGIMTLRWVPAVGKSEDTTSAVSMAAKDIFSRVRTAFSGSITVDAPDFVMHLMAMDSVYAYISWLKRVYRVSGTFSLNTRLTPEVILKAMGFSDEHTKEIMSNRTTLWGKINELVSMTQTFFVPDEFPIIQRHMWMSERIYNDAFSLNSQSYMFNCTDWYKFQMDESSAGCCKSVPLKFSDAAGAGGIIEYLYSYGKSMIEALSNWDDAYIINGYLRRAYGEEHNVTIKPLELNETVEFLYNEVVLSQIENAVVPGIQLLTATGSDYPVHASITQMPLTNAVIGEVIVKASPSSYWTQPTHSALTRLNLRNDNPGIEDVVEASRLISDFTYHASASPTLEFTVYGTEVVVDGAIYTTLPGSEDGSLNVETIPLYARGIIGTIDGTNTTIKYSPLQVMLRSLALVSTFDWHPFMTYGLALGGGTPDAQYEDFMLGDIHNMAFLSPEQLADINRVCLYSEFNAFSGT